MSDLQTNKLYVNRFSILLAFLALGFSLLYLIPLESEAEAINIFGFIFRFDFYGLFPLILALLAGVGAYWVFSTHPRWKIENRGVIKWFFRMEALRSSSEENCLGTMSQ